MKSVYVAMDPVEAKKRGVRLGTMAAERCYTDLEYARQCNPKHQIVEFSVEDDDYNQTVKSAYQQIAPSYVISEYVGKPSFNLILCRHLEPGLIKTAHKSWKKDQNQDYGEMPRLATEHLCHLYGTCGFILKNAGEVTHQITELTAEFTLPEFARATLLGKGAQLRDQVYRKITGQSILQEDEYEEFDPIQAANNLEKFAQTIEFLGHECQELYTSWKRGFVEDSESKFNLARAGLAEAADMLRKGDLTNAALTATRSCEHMERIAGKEGLLTSLYMDLGERFEDLDGLTIAKRRLLGDIEKSEISASQAEYIRRYRNESGGGFNRLDGY